VESSQRPSDETLIAGPPSKGWCGAQTREAAERSPHSQPQERPISGVMLSAPLSQKRQILHSTCAVHTLRENEFDPQLLLRFLSRGFVGAIDVRHSCQITIAKT
jgi:hypothetical protein